MKIFGNVIEVVITAIVLIAVASWWAVTYAPTINFGESTFATILELLVQFVPLIMVGSGIAYAAYKLIKMGK